jgi:hypothetical protein
LGHIDIGGHAGRILLEPDALHGISPLLYLPVFGPFLSRFPGQDVSFWAVLSNAAAHGKRLCAIDASRAKKAV